VRIASSLLLLLLLTVPAFADPPAPASPPSSTSRTEDLLLRIVRAIEELGGRVAQPTAVRWEYHCADVTHFQSADVLSATLNALGGQGWEWAGTLGVVMPGQMRVCFKRPGNAELSTVAGETGCSPTCGAGETCFKGVCIAACSPACPADQYCSNDRHCRTRTTPRR
jgi:hypothetical protein